MKMEEAEVPLSAANPLTIGIAYNLKKGIPAKAVDAEAEYDNFDTIEALQKVFERAALKTVLLEADTDFMEKVKNSRPDLVFNIAEGSYGRGREGQVPAMLDLMGIPYSGSDATTLCIALDKALTKKFLRSGLIATPAHQYFGAASFPVSKKLRYPLIVKPNSEGSSKGISDIAIVDDPGNLKKLLKHNFELYQQPMLAEEYIPGREFTVGLLGNDKNLKVFEPMEICYQDRTNRENCIYSYRVKQNYKKYVTYQCPAQVPLEMTRRMKQISVKAFQNLQCHDFARVDFRLSEKGIIYFIEINPLPGLAPGYSDYPMLAAFNGLEYEPLVLSVLNAALLRHQLPPASFSY